MVEVGSFAKPQTSLKFFVNTTQPETKPEHFLGLTFQTKVSNLSPNPRQSLNAIIVV